MNVNVDALNEIPLVTEVTSWNNLIGTAGGAAKADQLTTSRLIWGRPFNGSADVSGALTNVTSVTSSGVPLELTSNDEIRLEANLAEYSFKSTSTLIWCPEISTHLLLTEFTLCQTLLVQLH